MDYGEWHFAVLQWVPLAGLVLYLVANARHPRRSAARLPHAPSADGAPLLQSPVTSPVGAFEPRGGPVAILRVVMQLTLGFLALATAVDEFVNSKDGSGDGSGAVYVHSPSLPSWLLPLSAVLASAFWFISARWWTPPLRATGQPAPPRPRLFPLLWVAYATATRYSNQRTLHAHFATDASESWRSVRMIPAAGNPNADAQWPSRRFTLAVTTWALQLALLLTVLDYVILAIVLAIGAGMPPLIV